MSKGRMKRRAKRLLYNLKKPFLFGALKRDMGIPKPIEGENRDLEKEETDRIRENFSQVIRKFALDEKRFLTSRELICTYYQSSISLLKRSFSPEEITSSEVVVVSVIQNDRLRTEVLLKHYRRLGVRHFVLMDQGSVDGTREYLMEQPDVNLYLNTEVYSASKKEAWIGRLVGTIGRNHWFLSVDSDELVSFIGCENHTLEEAADWLKRQGFTRGKGVLADMYPKGGGKQRIEDPAMLEQVYCYFDTDSYVLKDKGEFVSHLMGGPRPRKTGIMNEWVSKSPLFFYGAHTQVINSHFQFPLTEDRPAPYVLLIRHFKYYIPDRSLFIRKEEHKVMQEFKQWATSGAAEETDFYYSGSCRYEDSSAIKRISFIRDMFEEETGETLI